MDIEFNPGRISSARADQPIGRGSAATAASGSVQFERSQALEHALREQPEVRPERVQAARAKIGDPTYPPGEVLDRIAHLLAMNVEG